MLREALAGSNDPEGLEAARALVDRVIVGPGPGPDDPLDIELIGQLAAMLRAGGAVLASEDAATDDALRAMTAGSAKGDAGGEAPSVAIGCPPGPGPAMPLNPRYAFNGSTARRRAAKAERILSNSAAGSPI
ncbi:hypothetical protein [Neoroseomonas soli]|uniref:Uncharacterized protein n=1 Tax=Neoroseomonas soli TaxID=1081025 RepID=A0A9X9X269_9PROT|nr:hypothetical protein [Neoroseomonas soli]MBR0673498.1 hypothetical protein [Neoroseomonas soli]